MAVPRVRWEPANDIAEWGLFDKHESICRIGLTSTIDGWGGCSGLTRLTSTRCSSGGSTFSLMNFCLNGENAFNQGLTLVHISAQRKHILWDTLRA